MSAAPATRDRHRSGKNVVGHISTRPARPEEALFGIDGGAIREPKVETLDVLLDCGICTIVAPQKDVRDGSLDTSCNRKHNKKRK